MIRRPPRSTQSRSSAASDVYKRQPNIPKGPPLKCKRCRRCCLEGRWNCSSPSFKGALPFSPRKGKWKGKLAKRARRGQGTRLPEKVWLEVWLTWWAASPHPKCPRSCLRSSGSWFPLLATLLRSSCGGLRAPAQPGRPSKNGCGKNRFQIPPRRLHRKVVRNDVFRAGRGFCQFPLEGRNETRAARARSPAACRGGGGP